MKGIVFTEFLEMVEGAHGPDMVDAIIDDAALPNCGAYTAVGTYPHEEMSKLVLALSNRSDTGVAELLRGFGEYLFARFAVLYPTLFASPVTAFGFIDGVDSIIHGEVRKLYPDAELPAFQTIACTPWRMEVIYRSRRHLEDLAEGLMVGCARHFAEQIDVVRETVGTGDDRHVRFVLTRTD